MIALVTGGSRGIGAGIATALAADGFDVAITCRSNLDLAEKVAAQCRDSGVKAFVYQADISQEEDCNQLIDSVQADLGPVDVLVNNAGMNDDGLMLRMSLDQFESVVQTNLTGTFLMSRAVLPQMVKARQGRIINLTSVAGLYGNAGQTNYAAAKAGLIGLTKSLAKEMGKRQITVNAIAPGFIATDMTDEMPPKIKKKAVSQIDLGRMGTPADVAGLVCFLASEQASYITGQVIEVSGGLHL